MAETRVDQRSPVTGTPAGGGRAAPLIVAVLAAAVTAAVVLLLGGGVITDALPGLPPRDALVTWLVPSFKLGHDLLAIATVGMLVAAAFFVDGKDGRIRPQAYRWVRAAAWTGLAWVFVSVGQAVANYADYLAQPLSSVKPGGLWSYLWDTESGYAYLLTTIGAAIVTGIAFNVLTVTGAAFAAVAAVATTIPVVFSGHTAGAGNHQIAVDSMLFHVVGAVLWAGGLLALLLARKTGAVAVRRYSRVAFVAFFAVAASGIINSATRIPHLSDLTGTAYGREVVLKTVAVLLLGGFGAWHRRVTLPKLDDRPSLFRRIAGIEIVVMAATIGLAAGLSRTPSPPDAELDTTGMQSLLGYDMPGPLTAQTLLLDWYPELVMCSVAAAGIGLYLAGVVRLRRRGDSWPITRTLLWTAGWLAAVFVTSSGMGKYGMVLFSIHMVQHMTLNMLVPILLVLGAPITLALRALKPSAQRGPREWLLLILHSRFVKWVSHPLIALALYAFSLYLMYFTDLFAWAMRQHAGHLYMLFHFLLAGALFYWQIIGPDPSPRRIPYPAKILLFFVAIVFHTIFGLTIMQSTEVLAADWYTQLVRDWGSGLLDEQHTGGGIAWAFGEPPSLIVLGALVWQWSRSEEREARRIDRAADRAEATGNLDDDPHERYNAYLAKLAEADRKAGLRD